MNNSQETTTTTTTKITTNDDGEALVQQILNENPSEEVGVREEWKDHIGWHRQEDIRGDRVEVQTPHDHEQQQQYQQQQQRLLRGSKWMKHGVTNGELSSEASLLGYLALLLGLISVVLLCLLLLDWIRFRMRNRLFSPRKNR